MDHSREVLDKMAERGAVLEGHFVYTSRRHGTHYLEKRRAGPKDENDEGGWAFVTFIANLVVAILARFQNVCLAAPDDGAPIFAKKIAELCGIAWVRLRKDGKGGFCLSEEDARFAAGKIFVLFDDILTTGGTLRKAVQALEDTCAGVCLVIVIVNRGGITAQEIGVEHLESLASVNLISYNVPEGELCPLCEAGVPINTDVGHGKEFLAELEAKKQLAFGG